MNATFTPFPLLETERLELRQLTLDDDNEVFFQRSDSSMNKYVNNPPCKSIDEAREWINKINNFAANNESIFWGVCLKGIPKLIGGFCFWNLSPEKNKAEVGFGIYPEHQGKGFMSEVLQTGLQYGFEEMGLERVEAYTHPMNIASIRVLGKSGFRLKEQQPSGEIPYIVFELNRK